MRPDEATHARQVQETAQSDLNVWWSEDLVIAKDAGGNEIIRIAISEKAKVTIKQPGQPNWRHVPARPFERPLTSATILTEGQARNLAHQVLQVLDLL